MRISRVILQDLTRQIDWVVHEYLRNNHDYRRRKGIPFQEGNSPTFWGELSLPRTCFDSWQSTCCRVWELHMTDDDVDGALISSECFQWNTENSLEICFYSWEIMSKVEDILFLVASNQFKLFYFPQSEALNYFFTAQHGILLWSLVT